MERATARLRIVIPLTLFLIFLLLYLNFRNVTAPAVVMLSVPFGLIGGFWLVYWSGSGVMQRIAAPMVGGMVTSTVLCLLVLPVIYVFVLHWRESGQPSPEPDLIPDEVPVK